MASFEVWDQLIQLWGKVAMDTLRLHLGNHNAEYPRRLHVLEVGALVLRAGRAAGLTVKAEVIVTATDSRGESKNGEMDCGWFTRDGKSLIAAWEFDGRDVDDWHMYGGTKANKRGREVSKLGNGRKFAACAAPMKIQVLYALRNDLSLKPPPRLPLDKQKFADVEIVTDEDLMADGGIELFIGRAQQLAAAHG